MKIRMTYELTERVAKAAINVIGGEIIARDEIIPGLFWSYDPDDELLALNLVTMDDEEVPDSKPADFYRSLIEKNAVKTPHLIEELEARGTDTDCVTITLNHVKVLRLGENRGFLALVRNPQNS